MRDVVYMATVGIDGVDYQLQMDTGSSDLWVNTTKVPTTLVRLPTFVPDATTSSHASPRTTAQYLPAIPNSSFFYRLIFRTTSPTALGMLTGI
jgi:hypothetical protein